MLSKSLIQFSFDGWSCVPSLLFTLGPNCGGGNEDNGDLLEIVNLKITMRQWPNKSRMWSVEQDLVWDSSKNMEQ